MLGNPLCDLLGTEHSAIQASTGRGLLPSWSRRSSTPVSYAVWDLAVVSRVSGVRRWTSETHLRSKTPFRS